MTARLPTPGGDDGTWGDILNAYLEVSLASDGTLNPNVVGTSQLQDNAVTNAKLDSSTQTTLASVASKYTKPAGGIPSTDMTGAVQTSLGKADSSVQSSQLGATNGVATLNGSSQLTNSQLPSSVVSGSDLFYPEKYGAGTTADDTTALQACIDAAVANGQGRIILGNAYNVAGTPRTDRGGNAIIAFPNYGAGSSLIRFEGPPGGCVFTYTGLNTLAYSGSFGCPSVIGGPTPEQLGNNDHFSSCEVQMRDVTVEVPGNSTIAGIDLSRIFRSNLDQVSVRAAGATSAPTNVWAFGIRLGESNGGGSEIGKLHASGMYAGVISSTPHLNVETIQAFYNVLGLAITADGQYGPVDGHGGVIQYLDTENCVHHVGSWSPTSGVISMPAGSTGGRPLAARLVIDYWDTEDGTGWETTVEHLLDANNQLYGNANFGRVGALPLSSFLVTGGANFALTNVRLAPPAYALLASPTFTGNPAAPTQTALDNSTKLATTAYADSAIATRGTGRIAQRNKVLGYTDSVWDLYAAAALNTLAPATQQIYGTLAGFLAGDVVSNIFVQTKVAGAGTPPSAIYLGLFTTTGIIEAVSADVHASAIWTGSTKVVGVAMGTPFTIPTTGAYYLAILQNGVWGTTQMTLAAGNEGIANAAIGANPGLSMKVTGQTVMSGNVTPVADTSNIWFGWS